MVGWAGGWVGRPRIHFRVNVAKGRRTTAMEEVGTEEDRLLGSSSRGPFTAPGTGVRAPPARDQDWSETGTHKNHTGGDKNTFKLK